MHLYYALIVSSLCFHCACRSSFFKSLLATPRYSERFLDETPLKIVEQEEVETAASTSGTNEEAQKSKFFCTFGFINISEAAFLNYHSFVV